MMILDVYKIDGAKSGDKFELPEIIANTQPNDHLIYLSVKATLANRRQGTHKAKERSEVRGGGKKPWRQKGRGGARAGTTRSPLWVGGGTIFGPRPRDYSQAVNKKAAKLARQSALAYKIKGEQVIIVEDFNFESPKTKDFNEILKALKVDGKKILFLTNGTLINLYRSGRNINKVHVIEAENASTYDLLNNQIILAQKSAAQTLVNNMLIKDRTAV